MKRHADNPDSDEMRKAEYDHNQYMANIRYFTPEQLDQIARIQAEEEDCDPTP